MNKNQKGFTLIELMIVVAIIGILAAVAIPKFAEMMERSRDGATKGNIGALKSAISIYYGDHEGVYPTDLTGINPGGTSTAWQFLAKYIDIIPAVKSQGGNRANSTANDNKCPWGGSGASSAYVYNSYGWSQGGASSSAGTLEQKLNAVAAVGFGYKYESLTGLVWVNSTLLDMSTKPYSLFGYE
jgi:general secretion pathway protein G/type IV pilus assembly protein PilA